MCNGSHRFHSPSFIWSLLWIGQLDEISFQNIYICIVVVTLPISAFRDKKRFRVKLFLLHASLKAYTIYILYIYFSLSRVAFAALAAFVSSFLPRSKTVEEIAASVFLSRLARQCRREKGRKAAKVNRFYPSPDSITRLLRALQTAWDSPPHASLSLSLFVRPFFLTPYFFFFLNFACFFSLPRQPIRFHAEIPPERVARSRHLVSERIRSRSLSYFALASEGVGAKQVIRAPRTLSRQLYLSLSSLLQIAAVYNGPRDIWLQVTLFISVSFRLVFFCFFFFFYSSLSPLKN